MAEASSFTILDGLRDALVVRFTEIGRADLATRFATVLDRNARLDPALTALAALESECWAEHSAAWDRYWQEVVDDVEARLRQRFPDLDVRLATLYADPDVRVRQILKRVHRAMGMALLRHRQALG